MINIQRTTGVRTNKGSREASLKFEMTGSEKDLDKIEAAITKTIAEINADKLKSSGTISL